jgi:hypothetical protein
MFKLNTHFCKVYRWLFEYVNKKITQSNSDLMENLQCQVFMTVEIHVVVFWAVTPCSLSRGYQTFGELFCIQGNRNVVVRKERLKKYEPERKIFSQT